MLTLGVNDLEASLRFYQEGLGLATEGIIGQEFEHGAVAFFNLQPGLRLALWPRASIARDTGLPDQPSSATDLTIGYNANTKEEVDAVIAEAGRAGATIDPPPDSSPGPPSPAAPRSGTPRSVHMDGTSPTPTAHTSAAATPQTPPPATHSPYVPASPLDW